VARHGARNGSCGVMKITWINPAPIVVAEGTKTSERVCVRLRSMLPGEELARRGHDVEQVFFQDLPARVREPRFLRRDIFVFGKALADFSPFIHAIRSNSQAKVVIDICDNIFAPPEDELKFFYIAMLPRADAVITSGEFLSDALRDKIRPGVELFSVPDAVEGQRFDPIFEPRARSIRLLWFGYPNNLPLLRNELPNLSKLTQVAKVKLSVVSAWPPHATLPPLIGGIHIRYPRWSPKIMSDELKACDFVVVPSDEAPARRTKSANRIVTGIWAGKFVVAYPLPSYRPFEPFAYVDRDLVAGIRWALESREVVRQRISAGQKFIEKHYAIELIADAWERALGLTAERPISAK
jgi:hypothetical protein